MEYCRELGRAFRQDSGNTLFRFTRNRVRHDLLPHLAAEYNPRVREALVRLAHTSTMALEYLEGEIDRVWPDIVASAHFPNQEAARPSSLSLNRADLAALHPALRRLALRRAYIILAGEARRLGEVHLKAMSDLAEPETAGQSLDLPWGVKLESAAGRLTLTRGDGPEPCPYPPWSGERRLDLPARHGEESDATLGGWRVSARLVNRRELGSLDAGDAFTACLDAAALESWATFRAWQPGDRFQPLGMVGSKKLQDFFTDARIPQAWRSRIPLLVTEGRIAWVVGHRIAHWARVPETSVTGEMVVRIRFEQVDESEPG